MNHVIKPEEHELREAREIVKGALEACKPAMEKDENLEIELGWTGEEYVKEKMDGVSGFTHSESRIELRFNTSGRWKEMLKSSLAHEYAHSCFFEKVDREDLRFNWQDILFEAHAQIFAERMFDIETPWRQKYSSEDISEHWPGIRERLSEEIDRDRSLMYGNGELPEWVGYSVAYLVGQKILEEEELEDIPGLKRSDVIQAGDEVFG